MEDPEPAIELDPNTSEDVRIDAMPDHANVQVLPPFIYLTVLCAALMIEAVAGINALQWGVQLSLGLILISFGTGLITWCALRFSNAGTYIPPNRPTKTIVTDGPYSISRNPMYLSLTSIYLGLIILFDIVWGLPLLIPLIYIMRTYVIAREEAYLTRKFGAEYTDYQNTVRRWL